jgi:flagellar M-ring protein FliF
MEPLRKLNQQLRQVWDGMSRMQRAVVAVATAASAVLLGSVLYWGSQPEYQLLFGGLAAEDAGAITAKLQAQGVPYRLTAGGAAIEVPADRVHQARLDLAVEGLPAKSGKGFDLFDQTALSSTPFTQHVNYLRALQAELARTIMHIDPIVYARVHIVRPEPSPFVRDRKPPTASVVLKLRPGASLNPKVSHGIVALVARSVEGLANENVTLLDANGRMLSEDHNPDLGPVGSTMEYRREFEQHLASKAEGMLSQVLGPGRAVVRVTADLNHKRLREKKETYNPDARVAKKEKVLSSKTTTTSTGKAGAAGTASNLGKAAPQTGSSGSNTQEETIETDFELSKTTQEIEDLLGSVERLTVAALVDLSRPDAAADGGTATAEPVMSLADVQDIIKKAVGYKADRDEIKVTQVKMPGLTPPTFEEDSGRYQQWQQVLTLVRNGSLGFTALAALALGWLALRRVSAGGGRAPEALALAAPPPEPEDKVILERLSVTVQQNPQVLTQLLTHWLDQPPAESKAAR